MVRRFAIISFLTIFFAAICGFLISQNGLDNGYDQSSYPVPTFQYLLDTMSTLDLDPILIRTAINRLDDILVFTQPDFNWWDVSSILSAIFGLISFPIDFFVAGIYEIIRVLVSLVNFVFKLLYVVI